MEILALLLLGFIAMLAVVPPIIRGRVDASPLTTSQNFQRSMQEMGDSLNFDKRLSETSRRQPRPRTGARKAGLSRAGGSKPLAPRSGGNRRAAVRRNRIMAGLAVFAAAWGLAALVSGEIWCMVMLTVACVLLLMYLTLALLAPYFYSSRTGKGRSEEAHRPPRRAAM